ncbi:MAG: radical SAM protein [Spirochaetes bacterium]|nr:radical SAM protein [Spirochaetota bacterium]
MIPSRYNLITEIDENNYAIFNPLSGAFDIADKETKTLFLEGKPQNIKEKLNWIERGYFFNSKNDEEIYIKSRYAEFMTESSKNPVQFLFVQTYSCNFNCSYCYQKGINESHSGSGDFASEEIVRSFVDFVKKYRNKNNKEVFVSLFGGEPLLSGEIAKKRVSLLIDLLSKENIGVSVVTNGYNLAEYVDILKKANIKEIHVTLDGDEEIHNQRRFVKDGAGTFAKIIEGLKKAVENNMPVNIRLIIDRITLPTLPSLTEKLDKLGFLDLPKTMFKTSLGRNYELINRYMKKEDLLSLDGMYVEYVKLMNEFPILKKLHIPSFFGITRLIEDGEMYIPNFDACPATKSEYVLDGTGKIYGCTASCGRNGYEIGTFYPEIKIHEDKTADWQKRSILTIKECADCPVGVVCGGGCGVISYEKTGKILSPNCKPVKEIMDLGILYYKDKLI